MILSLRHVLAESLTRDYPTTFPIDIDESQDSFESPPADGPNLFQLPSTATPKPLELCIACLSASASAFYSLIFLYVHLPQKEIFRREIE